MILNAFISSSLLHMNAGMNDPKSVMLKLNIILNSFGIIRYKSCVRLLVHCWPTHRISLLRLLILTNDGKFSEKKARNGMRLEWRVDNGWSGICTSVMFVQECPFYTKKYVKFKKSILILPFSYLKLLFHKFPEWHNWQITPNFLHLPI